LTRQVIGDAPVVQLSTALPSLFCTREVTCSVHEPLPVRARILPVTSTVTIASRPGATSRMP